VALANPMLRALPGARACGRALRGGGVPGHRGRVIGDGQDGVVSRRQLSAAGVSRARVRAHLDAGRWQRARPGVYATFTGPLPPRARVWAAILATGPEAAAGPLTTLWLAGVLDRPPSRLDVVIPERRRVRPCVDVAVRRRCGFAEAVHPVASPPRMRLEEALLDACAVQQRPEAVVDLVLRAVQRRTTTAARVTAAVHVRSRLTWRALLLDLLSDVEEGVLSALERRWLRDVARPHRLPAARLNAAEADGRRRVYRDVRFEGWPLVVELDGRTAHPDEERFRDRRRDNRVTVTGRRTLRYGWHDLVQDPCAVAAEVAAVLRLLGRPADPVRCGRCAEHRGGQGHPDVPRS